MIDVYIVILEKNNHSRYNSNCSGVRAALVTTTIAGMPIKSDPEAAHDYRQVKSFVKVRHSSHNLLAVTHTHTESRDWNWMKEFKK